MFSLGERLEIAIWLDGSETPEQIEHWKRLVAPGVFAEIGREQGLAVAPPTFSLKRPGEPRVPPVPEWLKKKVDAAGRLVVADKDRPSDQPQAPLLLVSEALIVARMPDMRPKRFVSDLTPGDLADLRKRTREVWDRSGVGYRTLTDAECDTLIERYGPDAGANAVLSQLEAGLRPN